MCGCEWVIEAHGCDAASLADVKKLRALFDQLTQALELHPVGDAKWHQFPGTGGITGMCLLAESHLACHTYPEHGIATFNLYCCRARPRWPWEARLREALGAREVTVRVLARGHGPGGAP